MLQFNTYGARAALTLGEYNASKAKMIEGLPVDAKHAKEFTPAEIMFAYGALMTGPRAQRPTWRATRKAIIWSRRGHTIKGSWRSWPSVG